MVDVRVHMDTLEYTRQGLRTREAIPLHVGQNNRVVLVRPTRQPVIAASYGGFPRNLSFPGPAIVSMLQHEHTLHKGKTLRLNERIGGNAKAQVFAHSDANGSESENKALSDRRAGCVVALLTRDPERLVSIASTEAWGLDVQQVMLRSLGCDPGPVDGKPGVLTTAAVEAFQAGYGEGAFHRGADAPLQTAVAVDGDLGPVTAEALIDAYVSEISPRLSSDSLVADRPGNGCAFHNPAVSPSDHRNRRVSLVIHPGPVDHPEAMPCTEGDASPCAVVNDTAAQSCMWYREHAVESSYDSARHHHFLPSWLELTNGRYMLSVLTTVPEGETMEFQVFAASQRIQGDQLEPHGILGEPLGATTVCTPRLGVAQVVWVPPADFSPNADGQVVFPEGKRHPVFRVSHPLSQSEAYGPWPRLGVVLLSTDVPANLNQRDALQYRLFAEDGSYDVTQSAADAVDSDGYLDLYFRGLPKRARYSLTITEIGGGQTQVFENMPFSQLETLSDVTPHDLLHPFDGGDDEVKG
ncbi:MAG: hypothetical protein ACRBN8_45515 [Nannocystales bacterium]